jgi:hypothetical protein
MEAARRLREQQESSNMTEDQRRRNDEERRKNEEENQRQLDSHVNKVIRTLAMNHSAPVVCFDSTPINSVEVRLLAQSLSSAYTCRHLILHGKCLSEEDGVTLAEGMSRNGSITHLDLSRNELGPTFLIALSKCLRKNNRLEYISLEGNDVTAMGKDCSGILELAGAIETHHYMKGINLSNCHISKLCAERLLNCSQRNFRIIHIDISRNNLPLAISREIFCQLTTNQVRFRSACSEACIEAEHLERAMAYSVAYSQDVLHRSMRIEVTEKARIDSFWRRVAQYHEWRLQDEETRAQISEQLETRARESIQRVAKKPTKKGKTVSPPVGIRRGKL